MEDLSSRLKQVRTELNLSQTELAEKLDVQQADISRWESGKTTPNFQTLQKYSSLNVNVSWLFSGNGSIFEDKVDGTTYLERRCFIENPMVLRMRFSLLKNIWMEKLNVEIPIYMKNSYLL